MSEMRIRWKRRDRHDELPFLSMPGCPHLQAESLFVKAMCREVDFCPFRGPGARLLRKDTIPLLAAEINPASGEDQEQEHGPQHETNSSQNGIDR